MVSGLTEDSSPASGPSAANDRRAWLRGHLYLLAPFCAVVAVIVDLSVWNQGCHYCTTVAVSVTILAVVMAVALLIIVIAVRIVRRLLAHRGGIRPGRRLVAAAVTLGAAIAAPVELDWDDGCNEHFATIALAEAPYVMATKPEGTYLSYESAQTLVGCG